MCPPRAARSARADPEIDFRLRTLSQKKFARLRRAIEVFGEVLGGRPPPEGSSKGPEPPEAEPPEAAAGGSRRRPPEGGSNILTFSNPACQ
jgi:hypothetical protein